MELDVKVKKKSKGVFMISPAGSIDSDTYLVLEKETDLALGSKAKVIIFDMQGVNYISSAGLGVIFKAKRTLTQGHGKFCIVNLTPNVKKVFDMINALPELDVFASIEELDKYLDSIQQEGN